MMVSLAVTLLACTEIQAPSKSVLETTVPGVVMVWLEWVTFSGVLAGTPVFVVPGHEVPDDGGTVGAVVAVVGAVVVVGAMVVEDFTVPVDCARAACGLLWYILVWM